LDPPVRKERFYGSKKGIAYELLLRNALNAAQVAAFVPLCLFVALSLTALAVFALAYYYCATKFAATATFSCISSKGCRRSYEIAYKLFAV
jgi:hypothetical protein